MSQVVHEDCPDGCPTATATPYNGYIYRACRKFPAIVSDLQSDAERQRQGKDPRNCLNWGLSVWTTQAAVDFARDQLSFTRKRYIVRFNVLPDDGRLQHTPTINQDAHYTFWKFSDRKLTNETLHLEPVKTNGTT